MVRTGEYVNLTNDISENSGRSLMLNSDNVYFNMNLGMLVDAMEYEHD